MIRHKTFERRTINDRNLTYMFHIIRPLNNLNISLFGCSSFYVVIVVVVVAVVVAISLRCLSIRTFTVISN